MVDFQFEVPIKRATKTKVDVDFLYLTWKSNHKLASLSVAGKKYWFKKDAFAQALNFISPEKSNENKKTD